MHRHVLVTSLLACALAIGVITSASAAAAPSGPQVSQAAAQQALRNAEAVFTTSLNSGDAAATRDATIALRDLANALPALDGADRRAARDLLARPSDKNDRGYFGKEAPDSPICDAQFCVHWTDEAKNAPVSNQFLDDVLDSMALSYTVENTNLGWRTAKSDGKLGKRHGIGGDGQVDVYVTNLGSNLYGYASTDPRQRGTRKYAYLVLDNDYKTFVTPETTAVEAMQVTVAHEYNHILQFNIDTFEDTWLFEDTATWAEEQVYPGIDDYLNYIPSFSSKPDTPMTGSSIKIYSEAIWNHWLDYKYGSDIIRKTWEVSPSQDHFAVDSYNRAIKDKNGASSFGKELGLFFADTAEFHSQSNFPDNTEYPDVVRSGSVNANTKTTTLDNTSFRLYNVQPTADPSVALTVKAEKGTQSTIALIGRQGGEPGVVYQDVMYLPKGGTGTVTLNDPGTFSRITALVANVDGRSNRKNNKGKRVYSSNGSTYRFSLTG